MLGEIAALREALTLAVELGRKYSRSAGIDTWLAEKVSAEIESFFIGSPGKEQMPEIEGGECVDINGRDVTKKEYSPSPQILGNVVSSPQVLENLVPSPQDVTLISANEIDDVFEAPSDLC